MAPAIDLINVAGNAAGTPPGPYGTLEIGPVSNGGAGWSVAEVGDVNGDGFDDYVIGAPSVNQSPNGFPFPVVGTGNNGRAYLVFGSGVAGDGTFNWANLTPDERIATLSTLGNSSQNNPFNGNPQAHPFNGITFITGSQSLFSKLGASVSAAGDVNGDGLADFIIGAPGALDASGSSPNAGRAYLVYGSQSLFTRSNKTIDFDNPSANADVFITTFVTSNLNSLAGMATAGVGDFIVDGTNVPEVAIGAPNGSIGLASQGLTYVVNGNVLRPAPRGDLNVQINLSQVGQTGGVAGLLLAGDLQGDAAGWSVAGAGNTAARTSPSSNLSDLLIGAPDAINPNGPSFNGPGSAYLIYANTPANLASVTSTSGGITFIDLGNVGNGQSNEVPGAVFNGQFLGDLTGYSVASAGDFNGDGVADFLIGSPRWDPTNAGNEIGRANLIYGSPTTPNPPGPIDGVFSLSGLPNTISSAEFDGSSTFAFAGFSVSAIGDINGDGLNEIGIGSPGTNNGSGQVAIVAGNQSLSGVVPLSTLEAQSLGLLITQSNYANQPNNALTLLGTSVSGRVNVNRTIDADQIGDIIIGAAGMTPNTGAATGFNIGGGYAVQGRFLTLPLPPPAGDITTTIAIGPNPANPPFTIDKTSQTDLQIYMFANNTLNPPFLPVSQLDVNQPLTIVVDTTTVTFPAGAWTLAADPNNPLNAVITIPNGVQNLPVGSNLTFTVRARTLSTGPNANRTVTGTTTVTIVGPPPPPSGAAALGRTFFRPTFIPPYGSRFLPSPAVVYKFTWSRLPANVAYRQFVPARYRNPAPYPDQSRPAGSSLKKYSGYGVTTLGQYVFLRGKYPPNVGTVDARHVKGKGK